MRILVVEDDFACRRLLQKLLSKYGECDIAVDGNEAFKAAELALAEDQHYELVCLDIDMPGMSGHEVLSRWRAMEEQRSVPPRQASKVVMTTAISANEDIMRAFFKEGCDAYLIKPIERQRLETELGRLGIKPLHWPE